MAMKKNPEKDFRNWATGWLAPKAIKEAWCGEIATALWYPRGDLMDSDPEEGDPQYVDSRFFTGSFYIPVWDTLPETYTGLAMRLGYLYNAYIQRYEIAKMKTIPEKDKEYVFTMSDVAKNIWMLEWY